MVFPKSGFRNYDLLTCKRECGKAYEVFNWWTRATISWDPDSYIYQAKTDEATLLFAPLSDCSHLEKETRRLYLRGSPSPVYISAFSVAMDTVTPHVTVAILNFKSLQCRALCGLELSLC